MVNSFAGTLWSIHKAVREANYVQVCSCPCRRSPHLLTSVYKDLSLGIFRSDYMLHISSDSGCESNELQLKQIELNTYSCAGGVHACRASNLHKWASC